MARRTSGRPGRTLVAFFLATAALFGVAALGGDFKPALGLDLQGGTRIILTAKGDPSSENLDEARAIIDKRVNGSGVTEAEVTTEGGRRVVVEIPGQSKRDLVSVVKRQAQLRFRLVACVGAQGPCATATPDPATVPTAGATASGQPQASVSVQPSTPVDTLPPGAGVTAPATPTPAQPSATGSGGAANRPAPAYAVRPAARATTSTAPTPSATPGPTTGASTTTLPAEPTGSGTGQASPTATGSDDPLPTSTATGSAAPAPAGGPLVDKPLEWINTPDQASIQAFLAFKCPPAGQAPEVDDDPKKPLVTCDDDGVPYLLSSASIEGTSLTDADYGIPQSGTAYQVELELGDKGDAKKKFADISRALVSTGQQFAIVLDGVVISAPTFEGAIPDGRAQITGGFTQTEAKNLATSLKFGSLPIAFDTSTSETIGPSLAGDQLSAGITAGIVGLLLVMIYCLIYYRGLGLVVIASLLVAGGVTYGMVLLLQGAGFTLSLPGIAGLIVAVGITADSFIVYFERIRDEMRDGKSMRVAVEAGWVRARNTCLAADAVSLLAAVVLYIFAAGVVKGFAFTLGLSTLIDLAIFFWFTKPLVSVMARYRFFNRGHKLSGLDAEALGVDSINVAPGRA